MNTMKVYKKNILKKMISATIAYFKILFAPFIVFTAIVIMLHINNAPLLTSEIHNVGPAVKSVIKTIGELFFINPRSSVFIYILILIGILFTFRLYKHEQKSAGNINEVMKWIAYFSLIYIVAFYVNINKLAPLFNKMAPDTSDIVLYYIFFLMYVYYLLLYYVILLFNLFEEKSPYIPYWKMHTVLLIISIINIIGIFIQTVEFLRKPNINWPISLFLALVMLVSSFMPLIYLWRKKYQVGFSNKIPKSISFNNYYLFWSITAIVFQVLIMLFYFSDNGVKNFTGSIGGALILFFVTLAFFLPLIFPRSALFNTENQHKLSWINHALYFLYTGFLFIFRLLDSLISYHNIILSFYNILIWIVFCCIFLLFTKTA